MVSRRSFLKSSAAMSALASVPLSVKWSIARGEVAGVALSDPALQPKFANPVPDALSPGFMFDTRKGKIKVTMAASVQQTGLVDAAGTPLNTPVFGYGQNGSFFSWPGRTFEMQSGRPLQVKWENKLLDPLTGMPLSHPIRTGTDPLVGPGPGASVVDTHLHWCYSLPGYEAFNIASNGVPVVPHVHGGHTTDIYDGNPEYFFSPGYGVRGPRWVEKNYIYDNDQPAGNLWYHDHALGITRLNVYAGLAGFYFLRDSEDTGNAGNSLGLPAWPYEKAYAIQDKMFMDTGDLFFPSFPGDPFYDDFITGEGVDLNPLFQAAFPQGGPTALAEFFGDHMVVNGVVWPREDVEQRHYRLRLLNGTDSRFMGLRFRPVAAGATDLAGAGAALPFYVIGSDQGLGSEAISVTELVFEPGSRYDVVFDFSQVAAGTRVIMENYLGDAPFGGDTQPEFQEWFPDPQTDRVMAFDVILPLDNAVTDNFDPTNIGRGPNVGEPSVTRKVALFEGKDEFGRLQPLLGAYNAGTGEFDAIPWHMPTTENPDLGATEKWEIYNFTGDAHPVHLHLVHFDILGRKSISFDEDVDVNPQQILQHNGAYGMAPRISNVAVGAAVDLGPADGYVENAPKDMVTALPEQVTSIKATFDKPGRYVWHCHILSHEDHEMMRVLHVGPGA